MLPRGAGGALGTQSRSLFPERQRLLTPVCPLSPGDGPSTPSMGFLSTCPLWSPVSPGVSVHGTFLTHGGCSPGTHVPAPVRASVSGFPVSPHSGVTSPGAMGLLLGTCLRGYTGPPSKGASLPGLPSQRTTESVALNSGRDCLLALEATGLVRLWLWGRAPPRLCPRSRAIPGTPWLVALFSSLHEVCPAVSLQGRPPLL